MQIQTSIINSIDKMFISLNLNAVCKTNFKYLSFVRFISGLCIYLSMCFMSEQDGNSVSVNCMFAK
jgi:hypothetical protein